MKNFGRSHLGFARSSAPRKLLEALSAFFLAGSKVRTARQTCSLKLGKRAKEAFSMARTRITAPKKYKTPPPNACEAGQLPFKLKGEGERTELEGEEREALRGHASSRNDLEARHTAKEED